MRDFFSNSYNNVNPPHLSFVDDIENIENFENYPLGTDKDSEGVRKTDCNQGGNGGCCWKMEAQVDTRLDMLSSLTFLSFSTSLHLERT